MEDYSFIRQLTPPVTRRQLRPLDPRCRCVQFCEPLSEKDFKKVSAFMRDHPHIVLRVYGMPHDKEWDLEFLKHFPFLRHFDVSVYTLGDLSGLRYLPEDLVYLGLGPTKSKRHSLAFLERFPHLRDLHVEGLVTDFGAIECLSELEWLSLRSVTLPDLAHLMPLHSLLSLAIRLGGTKNLELLPEIGKIRYLELWRIRGLQDLSCLARMATLQYLFLEQLKNVTVLPSFCTLSRLRRVHAEGMKGLADLQPVADAPTLQELLALDMGHLDSEAFRVFVGHPTLERALVALGSDRKNKGVQSLLGLPPASRDKSSFTFDD